MTAPHAPLAPPRSECPPLPTAAWWVALLSLAGGLVRAVADGLRDPFEHGDAAVSLVLSAAAVAWVSAGVLAGRTLRTWGALALSALVCFLGAIDLAVDPSGTALTVLVLDVAALAALAILVDSGYHRWQRRHHDTRATAGIVEVVLLAALVGALGGVDRSETVSVTVRV